MQRYFLTANRINSEHSRGTYWTKRSTQRITESTTNSEENPVTHPSVDTTVKLSVTPIWLKDRTQVSLGHPSLPTNASLCIKWELNLHLFKEIQILHHLI
ncbi:hypothetical protein Hanom_Chr07g00648211 [Helianthus anomalus]